MSTEYADFQARNRNNVWQRYCGFIDFSIDEFMEIQEHLLLEEIELVAQSPLGEKIMKGIKPRSVEEFRDLVPLTTYDDYISDLGNFREDVLAEKPYCWTRTSGRGNIPKWVPYTQRAIERIGMNGTAVLLLACASKKGDVKINRGGHLLQNLPPRPFYSGICFDATCQHYGLVSIPPQEYGEGLSFEERTKAGFDMALRSGADIIVSLTTVLIKMGENFVDHSRKRQFSWKMLHPQVVKRLILAFIRSKKEKRELLPKDLWKLKGLICYGMDTNIYLERLKYYWGREPLQAYGSTETGVVAVQSWERKGMTFFPTSCFFEFIPEDEWLKNQENRDYQPTTVLLDQIEKGKRYELVITNFYGMPLLRYRVGDLIKIIALDDKATGIKTPQMVLDSRADDLIDIGGFTRLDEKTVVQAIINTGIKHADWTIRKEQSHNQPILHLYLELKDDLESKEVERLIHSQLVSINEDYKNLQNMLNIRPLKVTVLSKGSFRRYYEKKRQEEADLAHLKPPHMNAPEAVIEDLLNQSEQMRRKR